MSSIPLPFDWSKWLEYNWCTVEGIERLQRLVGPSLPYVLAPFQLGCTARMLNGQDVLCLSATGDGKSALIYLAPIAQKGTITLVVCPTNFLESDLVHLTSYLYKLSYLLAKLQVSSLQKKGVSAQAINAETLAAASLVDHDIWADAKTGVYQVLLFSPETTATDEYDTFIHDEVAQPWIGYFVVDEIHLVYEWGPEFRTLYETLFTMRA
jgi:superfamily II DNA helicase RecQ